MWQRARPRRQRQRRQWVRGRRGGRSGGPQQRRDPAWRTGARQVAQRKCGMRHRGRRARPQRQPQRLQWARESVGHLHFFTAGTALRTLRETGFDVVDWFYTAVELDLPPPAAQQQRLRTLRRIGRRLSPAWTARVLGGFSVLAYCRPSGDVKQS